ncbi:unnamed protein product, partial [Brenthis ino]
MANKKSQVKKIHTTEMRMLRWAGGITLRDRVRNEHIQGSFKIRPIEEKLSEARMRWYEGERAGAAATARAQARRRPARRAHQLSYERSKVRCKIERAYVNIGTFTSERVHQSGALTQRCAGTSPVRFLRRPIEKCRMNFRSNTCRECVIRDAAATRLPLSARRHSVGIFIAYLLNSSLYQL